MRTRIEEEARAEIVSQVVPLLLERLQDDIHDMACVSVHRVAGMLEISPESVKRLYAARIIHLGPRQQRLTLSDVKEIMAERRTGERPKLKKKPRAKATTGGADE